MAGNGGIFQKPVVAEDVGKDKPEEVSQERPQTGTETGVTMPGGRPEKPADELDSEREHKPADTVTLGKEGVAALDRENLAGTPQPTVTFTSGNVRNLKIGPFKFENGVLHVTEAEADRLDKMLSTVDARTRNTVRRVDTGVADKIGAEFLKSRRIRGIDTSADRPS